MITGELKSKVDRLWGTMCAEGIANPLSVIEQLTYLLFIKRLDQLHTLKERKASRLNQAIEEQVFQSDRSLTSRLIRFIEMVVEQLTLRGVMEAGALYTSPFTDLDSGGPDAIFSGHDEIVDGLFDVLREVSEQLRAAE